MKKLPILLLTLVLMGATGPMLKVESAQALELENYLGVGMDNSLMGVGWPVMRTKLASKTGGLVANTTDGQVKIPYIWPKNGQIEVEAESTEAKLFPRRILMVYYDYENGVTEAEADVKAQNLGEEDYTDWAVLVQEYQSDTLNHKGKFFSRAEMKLDEVNKTDIVYFAMEFGEREILDSGEVIWSNMSWVREKLDYRNCVHASNYQEGDNCKVVSTGVGTIDYWSWGKQPADEEILAWQEEWWTIQQQRLAKIDNVSMDVTMGFYYGSSEQEKNEWLDKGRDLLKQLQKMKFLLTKMEDPGTLVAWRDAVEQRLLDLGLKLDDNNGDSGDNKGDDNQDGSGSNGDLNQGGGTGSGDGTGGDGTGSGDDDFNKGDNDASGGQNQENRHPLVVVATDVGNKVTGRKIASNNTLTRGTSAATVLTTSENDDARDEVAKNSEKVLTDGAEQDKTEVDVPATGGTKRQLWDFWWVLIPVIGVLIMLILWLKRAFGSDED